MYEQGLREGGRAYWETVSLIRVNRPVHLLLREHGLRPLDAGGYFDVLSPGKAEG